jgi:hypothetical protein
VGGAAVETGGMGGTGGKAHVCGDGVIGPGETCDPPSTCPTSCPKKDACSVTKLTGSAAECTAKCDDTEITMCSGLTKDGCCPMGCTGVTDIDCAKCGNGVVDLGETCDDGPDAGAPDGGSGGGGGAGGQGGASTGATGGGGTGGSGGSGGGIADAGTDASDLGQVVPCPTSCSDLGNACQPRMLTGSANMCDVKCVPAPAITQCVNGDGCCPATCTALTDSDCLFPQPSYAPKVMFDDVVGSTVMTITWDGTSYWECSGGDAAGVRLAHLGATGQSMATYSPGIDFRSVFTLGGSGPQVYARGYNNDTLMIQTSPGVFSAFTPLTGGMLDPQASVFLAANNTYVATITGTVSVWNSNGTLDDTFQLVGFGSLMDGMGNTENEDPQNRGIAVASGFYLTYFNHILSAWDGQGNRLKQTTLTGSGTTQDSYYSLSYANGLVFVVDVGMGLWRGYDVGL